MPFADPEEQRRWQAEYYRQNRERLTAARLQRRYKNLGKERARDTKNDRDRGRAERPKGKYATPELHITPQRGWHLLQGRLYFSTLKGFTLEDVQAIVEAATKAQARIDNATKRKPKNKTS
jgi:hypothetical protein